MIEGYFDGAAEPNPGAGAAGAYIEQDGQILWQTSCYIGNNITNNVAEYRALIMLLEAAQRLNIKSMIIYGDSQLVINQMNFVYNINKPELKVLAQAAFGLLKGINVTFMWIKRENNKRADELSREALNNKHGTGCLYCKNLCFDNGNAYCKIFSIQIIALSGVACIANSCKQYEDKVDEQ